MDDRNYELIELGDVFAETKGPGGLVQEEGQPPTVKEQ